MDAGAQAMVEQHDELAGILGELSYDRWETPSRCPGWSITDVVLHLAQTDEMAIASLDGSFDDYVAALVGDLEGANDVDEFAGLIVERDRGATAEEVHERWQTATTRLAEDFDRDDLADRVPWVAGMLAPRTLAVTRLAECWAHTRDIAEPLGIGLDAPGRLHHIVRLSWRTLPYAFSRAGRELSGPVAFELEGPLGEAWTFVPDEVPVTVVRGSAFELCEVATQRREAAATGLTAEGPDADAVLGLVRSFA